jgi:RND family efflux transporter MFP subunit
MSAPSLLCKPVPHLALTLALASALSGCAAHTEADPRTEPALVRTATVETSKTGVHSFTGTVSARVESNLGFRVPGKVTERLVDAGQTVQKGQPLMRIDRTDLALADTASAGQVAAAKAQAVQTAADEKRLRGLVDAGAVSASAYDQAKAASDAAAARLKAAQAQASVSTNESGYSTLLADSDGVVMETLAEPGQVVAAGQLVVRLAHAGPREALISLPETVRPAIGSTAKAAVFGAPVGSSSAHLRLLSEYADPTTRTFEARYVLEGDAARAPLGSTVTVELATATDGAPAEIPLGALYDKGQGPGVWLVDKSKKTLTYRPVKVQQINEEDALVSSGLVAGDVVVAMGGPELHEGQTVRVANAKVAP